ncbi:MAG: hypothetical protein ACI37R_03290 [Candidatus Avigastranaerophilus sp.]
MGKSKKRNLSKNIDNSGISIKRNDVILKLIKNIRTNKNLKETENLISLFGITTEELLEAGADYEAVSAIKYMFL